MSTSRTLRPLLVCLVITATTRLADADAPTIHGVVRSQGHPVANATVFTTTDATVTDAEGRFTIITGDHQLTVAADGYTTSVVTASEAVEVELATSSSGEVIEVKARAPDQTKAVGYRISAEDVRSLPGTGNDILRATQMVPGVGRIPFGFGGLVLRGTSPRDTAVYLDGIEVPFAYHFGGMTSFYPTAMLDSLTLTPGGFDSEYGRAQGGIVTMTSREPRRDKWRVGGSLGVLDSGATVEGPVGNGAISIGVRRSYFASVATPFVSADIPLPSYWDAQVRSSFGDVAHGRITPELFLSIDNVANSANGMTSERIGLGSMFLRIGAPYTRAWRRVTLHVVPWLGTDRMSFDDTSNGHTAHLERPSYSGGLRADVVRDFSWGYVAGGLDAQGGYLSRTQAGATDTSRIPGANSGSSTLAWTDIGLWLESRAKLGPLSIKRGVRFEHYGLTNEAVLDPRLNVSARLNSTLTLRGAFGRFHQPPTPADVDPHNGNPALHSSYFDQGSLGLEGQFANTTASVTGFLDYGHDLGVAMPDATGANPMEDTGGLGPTFQMLLEKQLGFATYRENVGRARSFGGELAIKHRSGRWFGMLAYTLSKSQRDDSMKVNALGWRPYDLDQRHNLDIAGSVALGEWRLGARFQLVSGNPYTSHACAMTDGTMVCTPQLWASTLPWFYELDLRADRRWRQQWGDVNLFFDIRNATNHQNVEGRKLDMTLPGDRNISGLPILPFIGVEFVPH